MVKFVTLYNIVKGDHFLYNIFRPFANMNNFIARFQTLSFGGLPIICIGL